MNRKLLPSLIAALTVSATGVVNAADYIPTVYGKVNVTLNKYDFDRIQNATTSYTAVDNTELESNSSRIGVKGDYPVFGDTKAIYKLEYELYTDGSPSSTSSTSFNTFRQRNTYAGLQGGWGTLFAGKNDSPLKAIAAETIQLFKDLPLADFKYVMVGENRENNIIQYATPTLGGFVLSVMIEPGEDSGADNVSKTHTNHGIADKYSAAATYKLDTLYLAAAADHNVVNTNTVRLLGQYGIGPVVIGALWQSADRNYDTTNTGAVTTLGSVSGLPTSNGNIPSSAINTSASSATGLGSVIGSNGNPITDFASLYKKQDAYALSVGWNIDSNWVLKAQYAQSNSKPDSSLNLSDTKAKNYVAGVDYKFNDRAKVFAYYASIKTDGDNSKYDGTLEDKTYAVGWEFKF